MYDQHYNSSNINSSLDGISTRHQYNHDKDYVASYNYEGNNNSDSDTSDRQNLASNNSNNAGISNTDSDYI